MKEGKNMQYGFTYIRNQMVCWKKEKKKTQQNKKNKAIKYNTGRTKI